MSGRERQSLLEEQDGVLQDLFDKEAEEQAQALWNAYQAELEAGTAPEVPEELDAKCREWIRASEKKYHRIRLRKFIGDGLKRAAIVVLVFLCIASTLAMSVDAIRVPVMNLFVTDKDRYSTIFFGPKQDEESGVSPAEKVLSTRLPSGYEIISVEMKKNGGLICRSGNKESGKITVSVIPTDELIDFDTEDAEQISTTIYDWPAIYVEKNGYRLIWFNSELNYTYDINTKGLNESDFWEYVYRLAK